MLIVDAFDGDRRPWLAPCLSLIAFLLAALLMIGFPESHGRIFFQAYTHDTLADIMNVLFLASGVMTVLSGWNYISRWAGESGTFYGLVVLAVMGMMLMVSASELLTLFVAVETTTIALYILSGYFKREKWSAEAGIKFVILGTVFSVILLFGMVLVYGATGTTVFTEMVSGAAKSPFPGSQIVFFGGMILILAGLIFKITAVPFHFWAPDAYTGAPTPVTAFLSVASKASGFGVLIRLFYGSFNEVPGLQSFLIVLLVALAGATMIVGNLMAIPQKNIKRLLAYSSIAQAGYMMIGLSAFSEIGMSSILFYLAQYVFATFGIFVVCIIVYNHDQSDDLTAYEGLSKRSPFVALVLLVCLLSLAGIPPLAGFIGKVYLFTAGLDKGHYLLVTIGILTSVVSVYYYLLILKRAYIEKGHRQDVLTVPHAERLALWIAMAGVILLGLLPGLVVDRVQMTGEFILGLIK